jgi:hypothetical protein
MADAGFTDIETVEKPMPFGPWPKDKDLKHRGRLFLAQFVQHGLETYSSGLFTRAGGWNHTDLRKLLSGVTQEVVKNKMHLYTHLYVQLLLSY